MAHDEVKHDFHLVNPSPWPLLGSIAVVVTALGGVTYMKGLFGLEAGTWWLLALGLAMVMWVMFGWWREVIKEGNVGDHTPVVQIGLRYGMILFIASEVMFFAGWFWSFFEFAIFESARVGETWDSTNALYADGLARFNDWPPVGVETFDPFHLPLINTLILLLSGTTVTWAHHALQHGDRAGARNGLILTVILGFVFTLLQAYEYSHAQFTFDGTLYGSAFFMATGFHGAHVVIGTIFLAICLIRLLMGGMSAEKHLGFEFAAWYWHFVDVVWLFLFAFVYVVPHLVYGG
ncbi:MULTISPECIES: cytochrome c oxidase subunit 3 [Hyphomonas]|jgi:cytochrome c oxidase subunit 3|uniref:Probable cytochrome c oxidase subunit 3 n=1 Tax=Hyphomonas atlantica TaxID=1280948 RepID=A0A059DYW0_9PROT|nr:cytochrome c oxidase subunit 3 [Hyphomonas atlantica]KCZ59172.1 cytochrome B562 [Hyphomonas atlantica]HAE95373.1 cytochrome c oxidase subunit 3 [Hyphomonas atlantica]HBH44980.1 cytochrome c oxidase subunit 3 [Hyphomonas atlantica]|tara:strand:+ start:749 stop:1621 length:873 start_codon:yes stop_codon:yes gene_type:complete